MLSVVWENIVGWNETENESEKSYCTLELMTVLRAVRKEMGVLFWTMPWYSRSEISFRVTESRCACSLILGTSCRDGSVSCILRKIMLRFISWIMTRMLYRTSLSDILSKMAGSGCEILRQVSLDRTAKTRQLLKKAENGWKCWKCLKLLVYQDYHANLPSSIFSICQKF